MDSNYGNFLSYQNNGGEKKDFHKLTSSIGSNIQKISQNVLSMQKMVNHLGTSQDSPDLRLKLHQIQHYTNNLAKDTCSMLGELSAIPAHSLTDQRECKMQKERLTEDFTTTLNAFQDAQRFACQKEKDEVISSKAAIESNIHRLRQPPGSGGRGNYKPDPSENSLLELQDTNQTSQIQSTQDHSQLMKEVENLQRIEEQEQAIRKLEQDIQDVNTIFKDLSCLIHDQGEIVDSIEAFVERAEEGVTIGNVNLRQALESKNKQRKKLFVCYAIVVVFLLCLIIFIFWK